MRFVAEVRDCPVVVDTVEDRVLVWTEMVEEARYAADVLERRAA